MKAKVALIFVALFAALLQSCTEDEPRQQKAEPVQFTFSLATTENNGGRTAADELPPDAELVLTLTDNSGTPVLTNHRIAIMSLGEGYITAPLEFDPGRYTISDFMIASGPDILYAVPKKNTALAPVVVRPLPHSFNVQKSKITNVAMEVVSTKGYMPEDFGYVSFGINIVNPLSIAVFTSKMGDTQFATAEAFLYKGETLISSYDLQAKVNLISFKGDPEDTYKLIVRKSGYSYYVRTFKYSELIDELEKLPLKILLYPAFTIETDAVNAFEMILEGSGTIDIDWGDGIVETGVLGSNTFFDHTYASADVYYITITGDIANITEFYSYYGNGKATDVNFEHLTGMTSLRFGLTTGPAVLDLTHNVNLTFVNIANIPQLEQLILPPTHNIHFILVDGPNLLNTADIDGIINSIHTNAVANSTHNGVFGLSVNWAVEAEPLIGPPSPAALAQLVELRDDYGWEVSEF